MAVTFVAITLTVPLDLFIEEGKMSNESPVGKALIGAKKGDTVSVETPAGLLEFKVLSIKNS